MVDLRAHITTLCGLLGVGGRSKGGPLLSPQALSRETWTTKQTPQGSPPSGLVQSKPHQFPWLGLLGGVRARRAPVSPWDCKAQSRQNLDGVKGGLALRGRTGGPEEGSRGGGASPDTGTSAFSSPSSAVRRNGCQVPGMERNHLTRR